jgi:hypothetical protein
MRASGRVSTELTAQVQKIGARILAFQAVMQVTLNRARFAGGQLTVNQQGDSFRYVATHQS